ncbi:Uncharacterised protein [Escherichia coli]|nr:Uncharacterised protein [Escherichia coli]CUA64174.1 Uncharacterised protein [Escherichia coli]
MFCPTEHAAQNTLMQFYNFINDCGSDLSQYTDHRCVSTSRGKISQIATAHFAALTREFQQSVLVNGSLHSFRQRQIFNSVKAVNVLQDILSIDFPRRLKQPRQTGYLFFICHQQGIKRRFMRDIKVRIQRCINCFITQCHCFSTGTFQNINARNNNSLLMQVLQ